MTFLRLIQWYHSHADPIWPGDTLNVWTVQQGLKENFMYCMLWRRLFAKQVGTNMTFMKSVEEEFFSSLSKCGKRIFQKWQNFRRNIMKTSVGDPDPHGVRLDLVVLYPDPYWECGSGLTNKPCFLSVRKAFCAFVGTLFFWPIIFF